MKNPTDGPPLPRKRSAAEARFKQARAVFEAALEKPDGDRNEYVESACVGDEALLADVRAMLEADGRPGGLVDRSGGASDSSAPEEGRFPAGTVLAGRYRVLGLLGKGGMGEVYRAFDVILNQTVALKFLTESRWTEAALVRFRNEVRIARQVSHPNVCRVYDLGMADGLHYLSMEYIDGENLASLLRRIGRLPEDKAMEFTRKLCAGLAAAHERGVLHRDLKPANIMIDGRGQVRITDFGLAGLAEEIPLSDLGSGTPAYMSPEQKAGKEVTARSDIYSLGLVLHEMFTGHSRDQGSDSHPTDLVKDLDPAIERVILQCLDEDPRRRPSSALRVAMALPGGDAVAAALAAGETPSPEAVAASEEKEVFGVQAALLCLGAVVLCFAGSLLVSERFGFLARAPLELSPDALTFQARSLLEDLGYTEVPAATTGGWLCCDDQARQSLERLSPDERDERLAGHRPPVIQYFYRQHRAAFRLGYVAYDTPPNTEPGMIKLRLDATGRLLELEVEPWAEDAGAASAPSPETMARLFEAAGLPQSRFNESMPERLPPMTTDARLAWTGTAGGGIDGMVRVEAAFWQGRPVLFEVTGLAGAEEYTYVDTAFLFFIARLALLLLAGALLLAWHKARGNRLDRRGALVLIGAMAALYLLAGLPNLYILSEGGAFDFLVFPVTAWVLYVSIEPLARRHWPDSLISWTRLSRGRARNALVASHIMAGIVLAEALVLSLDSLLPLTSPIPAPGAVQLILTDTLGSVPVYLFFAAQGMLVALTFLALVVLARLVIRKMWLADLAAVAAFNVERLVLLSEPGVAILQNAISILFSLALIWMMRRFGFLSVLATFVFAVPLVYTPLAASGWMAGRLVLLHLVPVAVAAWALWVILTAKSRSTETVT
jgi:serine/threonine-protein kinase